MFSGTRPSICIYRPQPSIWIYQRRPSICIFRPLPLICIYRHRSSIRFYQPWYSICVSLFFVLLTALVLNLCLPVLRFTFKVCFNYSVYSYKLSTHLYVVAFQVKCGKWVNCNCLKFLHKRYFRFSLAGRYIEKKRSQQSEGLS